MRANRSRSGRSTAKTAERGATTSPPQTEKLKPQRPLRVNRNTLAVRPQRLVETGQHLVDQPRLTAGRDHRQSQPLQLLHLQRVRDIAHAVHAERV